MVRAPIQDLILNAFDPNSSSSINRVNYWFNSDTTGTVTIGLNEYPDLSTSLKSPNSVASVGVNFDTTAVGTSIEVEPGSCIINGVLIETESSVIVDTSDSDNYFFSDSPPTTSGYIYLVLYHDPSEEDLDAKIGFVRQNSLYSTNRGLLCTLSIMYVNCSEGSIVSIGDIYSTHPEDLDAGREIPPGFLDGGWIGTPLSRL